MVPLIAGIRLAGDRRPAPAHQTGMATSIGRSRTALLAFVVSLLALMVACGASGTRQTLPPPVQATTVGVGDVFEVAIMGEEKFPPSYTVASDGTVTMPYIRNIKVAGLEPQQIADLVRDRLIQGDILTDPNVTVKVTQYHSKRLEVLGEVQQPGAFPLEPGMTLVRAISVAGGFSPIADKSKVSVRRKTQDGKTTSVTVNVEEIIDNNVPDVPLQAGDSINVGQRVF